MSHGVITYKNNWEQPNISGVCITKQSNCKYHLLLLWLEQQSAVDKKFHRQNPTRAFVTQYEPLNATSRVELKAKGFSPISRLLLHLTGSLESQLAGSRIGGFLIAAQKGSSLCLCVDCYNCTQEQEQVQGPVPFPSGDILWGWFMRALRLPPSHLRKG